MVENLFKDAMDEFRHKPYAWPSVSCVAFIKVLSRGLDPQPDYRHWEPMLETSCLLEIAKQPGKKSANYVKCHEAALGSGWLAVHTEPSCGDILFVERAWGLFAVPDEDGIATIHWESPKDWGATIFPDGNGKFYAFSPEHGLKLIHAYDGIIAHYRRRDA